MTDSSTSEIIGKNIRFLRLKSELTLSQLADELNINPRHLGNIENGKGRSLFYFLINYVNFSIKNMFSFLFTTKIMKIK